MLGYPNLGNNVSVTIGFCIIQIYENRLVDAVVLINIVEPVSLLLLTALSYLNMEQRQINKSTKTIEYVNQKRK